MAQAVTSIAGSSEWFERGYVTYSNAAKREALGVSAKTLLRHGAVSEPTAREMARGALKKSRAGIALAITGIAGPGGGRRASRSARSASPGRAGVKCAAKPSGSGAAAAACAASP